MNKEKDICVFCGELAVGGSCNKFPCEECGSYCCGCFCKGCGQSDTCCCEMINALDEDNHV